MQTLDKFYINGEWIAAKNARVIDVINPATESACAQLSLGTAEDVDNAVRAAQNAFESFSQTSRQDRLALLD
ncbi:MAG: aldehyde dehydrogenase family protein, partial [Robiginitomaculum sp.]